MRYDLILAPYAVALGYTLEIDGGRKPFEPGSFVAGVPHDGLSFTKGKVSVWSTSRGWRVSKLVGDRFPPPAPGEFYDEGLRGRGLAAALEFGAKLADEAEGEA